MAERNPQVPHSIQSLLYVERNGNYCGYKPELITDGLFKELEVFISCFECKGICRKPRKGRQSTVCQMCVTGTARPIDERVQNNVAALSSKCPLSGNGCDWTGELKEIENHMQLCNKFKVGCQQKCGIVFERERIEEHQRVCVFKMKECEHCKQLIETNKEGDHIRQCRNHPDAEIICPYVPIGCDELVFRKNAKEHMTENAINHQRLIIDDLRELRNETQVCLNEQRRARIGTLERDLREEIGILGIHTKKVRDEERIYLILLMVAAALASFIAIVTGITLAITMSNNIQSNTQQLEHTQHLYEYVSGRGKNLPGRDWVNVFKDGSNVYGSTFYLAECKLQLKAEVSWNRYYGSYVYSTFQVERKKDDSTDCSISYIYAIFWYLDNIKPKETMENEVNTTLAVGSTLDLMDSFDVDLDKSWRFRVYFDNTPAT